MLAALAVAQQFIILPASFPESIEEYSMQADYSVLYEFDDMTMDSWQTPLVEGRMQPFEALQKLLAGLPIRIQHPYRRTITLTRTAGEPVKPAFFRSDGWDYSCTPIKWLSGWVFNRMGQQLFDLGFIDADFYCIRDHPAKGKDNNANGWSVSRLPWRGRLSLRPDAILLSTTDREVIVEAPRPVGIDHGPRAAW